MLVTLGIGNNYQPTPFRIRGVNINCFSDSERLDVHVVYPSCEEGIFSQKSRMDRIHLSSFIGYIFRFLHSESF
jgi:hypothetical protein